MDVRSVTTVNLDPKKWAAHSAGMDSGGENRQPRMGISGRGLTGLTPPSPKKTKEGEGKTRTRTVHKLKRREDLAEAALCQIECLQAVLIRLTREERHIDGGGLGRDLNRHLGNQAERALGADEELLQIVSAAPYLDDKHRAASDTHQHSIGPGAR